MFKRNNALIPLAVALLVAGCGGGGGGSGAPDPGTNTQPGNTNPASTTSGRVVDGYLASAVVVCDANNNGVRDPGEETVITDTSGSFTFTSPCGTTIVATGGTDVSTGLPFKGLLKAPNGSIMITPITTLLANSGLTNDQLVQLLGLPPGTNLVTLDPAALDAAGAPLHAELRKRTLAVQQILQQTSGSIAGLAQNQLASQAQAIYAEAAKAVAAVLLANPVPLFDASGNVNSAQVNAIVQQALANVAASADARLAEAKTSTAGISQSNLAALVSAALAAQSETLSKSVNSDALTRSLQSDTTIMDAVRQMRALLTTAAGNSVSLASAAASLARLVAASAADKLAAAIQLALEVDKQSLVAAVNAAIDTLTLNTPTNYLDVVANAIRINGHEGYDLAALAANTVSFTAGTPASINTIAIRVDPNGLAPASGVTTIPVSLGFELADTGGSGQIVQLAIDQVELSVNATNQVTVTVPASAKMVVYGKNAAGASANLTLSNLPSNLVSADSNNLVTFNSGAALALATAANSAVFSGLQTMKGRIGMKLVISNVDVRQAGKAPVGASAVLVTGADQPAVSGAGFQGVLTIL